MRIITDKQKTLSFTSVCISARDQWEMISSVLDANPEVAELVWGDLTTDRGGKRKKETGARGMTADQVLRFAIVEKRERLSYRRLHDRVDDSIVLREFCRVPFGKIPAVSTLQDNIKKLRPETLSKLNAIIVRYAREKKIEDGARVRIDTTGVESNIHHPSDSAQLWDSVRVLTRVLRRVETDLPRMRGRFSDHTRAAKRLRYRLVNARSMNKKRPLYRRLIKIARKVVGYARRARAELRPEYCAGIDEMLLAARHAAELEQYLPLAEAVIDQSVRRVLNGEQVPAAEKVVSIFEPHTDIIKKGQREIIYGHKALLSGGRSNLILDCRVERGNPADSGQFIPALERHDGVYDAAPGQVATDAGFASADNARNARALGVKDVVFAAPNGAESVTSARTYKRLRNWRSGIEGVISAGKRAFGLNRCTWSGFESFQSYVQLAVLAFNLQTLARHLLA